MSAESIINDERIAYAENITDTNIYATRNIAIVTCENGHTVELEPVTTGWRAIVRIPGNTAYGISLEIPGFVNAGNDCFACSSEETAVDLVLAVADLPYGE